MCESGLDKLSKFDCDCNKKYPLLSQFGINIIVGILLIWIGMNWVKPNPKSEIQYSPNEREAKLIFSNDGLLPADSVYNMVSGPTVVLQEPKIISGEEYLKTEKISPNSYILKVKDLPQNQKVIVGVATADTVRLIGNIEVTREK